MISSLPGSALRSHVGGNRWASLAMSTSVLKALPCKLDFKTHSPSIRYIQVASSVGESVSKPSENLSVFISVRPSGGTNLKTVESSKKNISFRFKQSYNVRNGKWIVCTSRFSIGENV